MDWLLVLVPAAIVLEVAGGPPLAIFIRPRARSLPLAGLIRRSTEQLALHVGPRVGGLINATFGNVTELIIAFFLILDDRIEIVEGVAHPARSRRTSCSCSGSRSSWAG